MGTPTESRPRPDGDDLRMVIDAAAFAADRHKGQTRKDAAKTPYINHPIKLAQVLAADGEADPAILAAALLHDTIEDTSTTSEELAARFGDEVRGLVEELSDDKSISKQRRKALQVMHAKDASPKARRIKLADKICNLRDLADSPPADWSPERLDEYFAWAAAVVAGLRGWNAGLEAAFDDAYAQRERVTGIITEQVKAAPPTEDAEDDKPFYMPMPVND